MTYMCYHLTRKVVSVVTPVLKNGSSSTGSEEGEGEKGWAPFDNPDTQVYILQLDT